ncbi:Os06g0574700 [Oryza sativa Japonica Group]|uniref:Uncharacterized protein n=2 Tax=Oryza sativa subsp. japonica TaxID=39947 RepID=A0A8J8XX48_ORYSJ|nr:hypothetical protein OsJ_21773 [Oryza sativa Japonica Group]BAS98345.1 Os06g0574700 [Oryza sativa Japonica Group]
MQQLARPCGPVAAARGARAASGDHPIRSFTAQNRCSARLHVRHSTGKSRSRGWGKVATSRYRFCSSN